jgi:hypothetical protein
MGRGTSLATLHRLRVRLPDYHAVAEHCGVRLCVGPPVNDCGTADNKPRIGFVISDSEPTVHWQVSSLYVDREKVPTRRSLYKFCKLAYRAKNPQSLYWPKWLRTYEEARYARVIAATFRYRIYREILEEDRAKVRFYLRDPQVRKGARQEKAWRWAEKRG